MGQVNNGIEKIELGAIAADGGMGTTLASLGFTAEDSVSFNWDEADITEYFAEETDTAWAKTKKEGGKAIEFTLANPDAQALVKLFGGSVTGTGASEVYKAPATSPTIEQSLKITPKVGFGFNFPRVLVTARFTDSIGRNSMLGVVVRCEVLQPTKSGEPAWSTFQKAAV